MEMLIYFLLGLLTSIFIAASFILFKRLYKEEQKLYDIEEAKSLDNIQLIKRYIELKKFHIQFDAHVDDSFEIYVKNLYLHASEVNEQRKKTQNIKKTHLIKDVITPKKLEYHYEFNYN
ncbi:hypothetical protein H8S90_21215 [Olivibacter sp. SDN3]|uniref:hypothetical protein n=1 Tax=Olivibacter sp. SDN3 TaxID=2764720 RepID=UPI0016518364|nr:hypothetical protein [Olivibacter sp. SDN3]QNL49232.1 hypothetical protein H8S90_21215 [Olivibacter sp. SDN3]